MGIAGKWLKILVKILVGLRKSEKLRKFEMAANNKAITNNLWQQQKNSLNLDGTTMDDVRSVETASRLRDDNTQLSSTSASSHSILLPAEETSQTEQNRKEEWAATVIQTAFRAFLARRALRALKGLVKLQALVRGNAVRKQAAITLRCMQALVRVQARIRARRIRMTLETQLAQQKLQQQPEHEAHVRLIEERWCDSVGSVEDIQAKMLKRQEAAAKRERAMAYALSHQWQAASRQQPVPPVTEAEKHDWGLNWLERWMAVRPWENRFLGINLKDGVMVRETESAGVADGSKIRPKLSDGKPGTRLRSSIPNHSARSGFTSNRCASFMATSALPSVKLKLKRVSEEGTGEAISKPSVVGIQSYRNTKERDSYMKKRLSLPRNVPAVDQELALQTEFQQIAANAQ